MNFPDKRLREKGHVLNKTSLAPKYASFERFCKQLYYSGL